MRLASVLNPDFIYYGIPGKDAQSVYTHLLERMQSRMTLSGTPQSIAEQMILREQATGVTYEGVAYPHIRLENYDDLALAVGILDKPVRLHPDDTGETRMVIMSLVGQKSGDFYLKVLSAALRYFSRQEALESAVAAGTPEALIQKVEKARIMVKKTITAEDLMDRNCESIAPDQTLREAFDLFTRTKHSTLPVVNEKKQLLGVLDAADILTKFIPEYVFMMPSAQFLESFETFELLNREEGKRIVRDFMRPARLVLTPDTPLFRCTVELCRHSMYTIFITEPDASLVGELTVNNIIHRVLRG